MDAVRSQTTDFSSLDQEAEEFTPQWGQNAPKGGKTVLSRALREGNKVPLFFGQTFVNSLRDVGYSSTTSAVCEHVDNAIQWGATEVRVYFSQTGPRGKYEIDALVLDNGKGMPPHVLQVATAFGGSMVYENRRGIGRYGVGMKTAALSMGPVLEIYAWQELSAFYNMILDMEDISSNRSNTVELPEPRFLSELPSQITRILTRPMVYPKKPESSQKLLTDDEDRLVDCLGRSGTIIFVPTCDRLTYKTAQHLVDDAVKEMARVYRRQISEGLRLYVNNRLVEAFDPTYWMLNARHTRVEGITETRSRLVNSWPNIQIPISEGSDIKAPASVRLYALPIEDWYALPRKVLKNDLQMFEDHQVSFVRNDREVHIGPSPKLSGKRHSDSGWLRIQVDFAGELDEAFGVAMNKQGVHPKGYTLDIIHNEIHEDVSRVRESTARFRSEHTRRGSGSSVTEAERRANEADPLQGKSLPQPAPKTEEEERILETNLRTLAVTLKRDSETDEEAFERIRSSRFITTFKHDEYWPFYHVDFKLGKVLLTINTAHPFFTKLYEPLSNLNKSQTSIEDDPGGNSSNIAEEGPGELLVGLQMLLFSLARAQSQMTSYENNEERRLFFDTLRKEWSDNFKVQLLTP